MIDWQAFNIDLGRGAGRTSGYVKTYCPKCHENGKPKSDHSLSCNVETGAFKCHRCGYQGYATIVTPDEKEAWMRQQPWYRDFSAKKTVEKKDYAKPPQPRSSAIDPKIVAYFAGRGISEATLKKMRVTSGTDWMPVNKEHRKPEGGKCTTIHFNYVKDGEVVATKLRSGDKCFRMLTPDTEAIPYNIDSIKGMPGCYITEGEVDALSLHEIGLSAVISAISENEIHNVFESHLKQMDFIFICADHDKHGLEFAEKMKEYLKANMAEDATIEIISSYGTHPDGSPVKDANECLMLFGPEVLYDKIVNYKKAAKEQ